MPLADNNIILNIRDTISEHSDEELNENFNDKFRSGVPTQPITPMRSLEKQFKPSQENYVSPFGVEKKSTYIFQDDENSEKLRNQNVQKIDIFQPVPLVDINTLRNMSGPNMAFTSFKKQKLDYNDIPAQYRVDEEQKALRYK